MPTSAFTPIFPNELWLDIIPRLELKPLIAIRCTSRVLRSFAVSADIHPYRKSFLTIYLDLIDRPWFLQSRPWLLENLMPFDRQAYLDAIAAFPDVYIPEEFAMWILEWPERAVIRCMWPGLPFNQGYEPRHRVERRPGWNGLGMMPPTVLVFSMLGTGDTFTHTPGLLLWDEYRRQIEYLLLHRGERFRGYIAGGTHEYSPENLSYPDDPDPDEPFWTSWIAYLEHTVNVVQINYRIDPEGSMSFLSRSIVLDPSERVSASLVPWPPAPT
ncbi:hypothetical protein HGRIS_006093 [Hohenbuehelia grisea]|uniref:F-box domain-containing protein n=1 Tax=Hohenbuehelia grisea TaxID=104357 RepID=A0ABR3JZT6_9AGAR